MNGPAPILFCHYGNSPYLRYTLACAKLNCPQKEVILLGDDDNRAVAAEHQVTHVPFRDYDRGPLLAEFDNVYREVRGHENEYAPHWLNFVFRRWYFVANFVEERGLEQFWHFDSDTMIVDDLASHEYKFGSCDCTEQCGSSCLNGFIANRHVLLGFLQKVNELFQRPEYLQAKQQEYHQDTPRQAFNEMFAYVTYRDESDIRTIWLGKPIDGSLFDDCICKDFGMEMDSFKTRQRVKKILLGRDGRFFCVDAKSKELLQLNTLNLSWVPLCTFENVLNHSRKRRPGQQVEPIASDLRTLGQMPMPLWLVLKGRTRRERYFVKNLLRRLAGKKPKPAEVVD
ncbi:MAG: hypothetical protein DWQ31_18180 [Planctomycetota bacterium]|nr:MAG: hypothetical protein DWQ31_18180 [Planctomycetota bacterium]REJ93518.1 MAG: hypothetical protein DWQ35_10280 [Planctomycetota bacterium]REK24690.1 MAG: hypothetical protein DWQ42_13255 [Planctomycetota bacterium]REK40189.1 MAG: hypothetical protein DWQ46_17180 [Planctomycetota bacterium]